MYKSYAKTLWKEDGTLYGSDSFNNLENGIKNLEFYAKYREKQATNMGKAMKKLRTGSNFKLAFRGDSVLYGYNTISGGEEGIRRYTNDVMADGNPSENAQKEGYDGLFFYGEHPLKKFPTASGSIKASIEQKANGTGLKTEVQIPDVTIQVLNDVYGGKVEFINKVYTGDCAVSSFYRFTEDDAADVEICNLGINDALAAFWGADYVGNVEEFVYWYTRLMERAIDAGCAWVILTPVLQSVTDSHDMSARTVVDVYAKMLYDLADLYGVPILNGDEFSHNFNNNLIIDFTHFTCAGNESIGKRLAAPFIAGDLSFSSAPVYNGSMVGVRPQEDSVNVYGNACVEFSDKAPSYALALDNNDLYDTGVNRVAKGLAVFMNYPLDGTVKDLYDKTVLEEKELTELNTILTSFDKESTSAKEEAIENILAAQSEYIFKQATFDNVLFKQADLFARSSGARGTDAYKTAYGTRIAFLQGKHGFPDHEKGKVTWAFYTERDGMVAVPSMYAYNPANVKVVLDFCETVPTKAGYYLTFKTVEQLNEEATSLGISVSGSDTKETLITKIKEHKGYNVAQYSQCSPSDVMDWTDSDEVNYDFSEPSKIEITVDGYHNKRKLSADNQGALKIVGKGWHTITVESDDPVLLFGIQFISLEDYKAKIKAVI